MGDVIKKLKSALFWKNRRGNVSIIAGLCAIPVLAAAFGVIEIGGMTAEKARLQSAVDAGALAGAGRLAVAANDGGQGAKNAALTIAEQAAAAAGIRSVIQYQVSLDKSSVTLAATASHKAMVGFMGFGDQALSVSATAENMGVVPLCVLQTGSGGISLKNQARIRATGCAVHANKILRSIAAP